MAGAALAQSVRIPLSYDEPDLDSVGRLVWRGGLELDLDDSTFGGLSALDIDSAGNSLVALSDRGRWFRFALEHDARGFLVAARPSGSGVLHGVGNRPLPRVRERDSESLVRLSDGSLVVAYELRHRLLRYPAAHPPFSAAPRWLVPPPGIYSAPANAGIEALTAFGPDLLFALSENLRLADGLTLGWIGDGRHWAPFRYRPGDGYRPTGAATLPGGDILVLERRLTMLGGFTARIAQLPQDAILAAARDAHQVLEGDEVARLQAPLNIDNFEGIATHQAANGETLVYLVSDDNQFALQNTLLLAFALRTAPETAGLR
jgi:hypothetical protein